MLEFPHLPNRYRPAGVVTAGLEWHEYWQRHPETSAAAAAPAERSRRQLRAAVAQGATPAQAQARQAALERMLQTAEDTQLQEPLTQQEPVTRALRRAATDLGLEFYAERPEILRQALDMTLTEPEDFQQTAILGMICGTYCTALLLPRFMNLTTPEQYKNLFREMPAPLILAGLGHANAINLQTRLPTKNPQAARALLANAADLWLSVGALTAYAPEQLEQVGWQAAPRPTAN